MKIIFEFAGGSRDGQTDVGEQADGFYFITDKGTIGKRFKGMTEHTRDVLGEMGAEGALKAGAIPSQREKYEVIERLEMGDEVLIRCKFIGYEP